MNTYNVIISQVINSFNFMLCGKWNGNTVEGMCINVCVCVCVWVCVCLWKGSLLSLSSPSASVKRQEQNPVSPLRSHVCPLSHPSNFSWSVTLLIIILTAKLSSVTWRNPGQPWIHLAGQMVLCFVTFPLVYTLTQRPLHSRVQTEIKSQMTWRNTVTWDCN